MDAQPPTEIRPVAPPIAEAGPALSPPPSGPIETQAPDAGAVSTILNQPSMEPETILKQVADVGKTDTSQDKSPPGESVPPAETILVGEAAPPESQHNTSEGNNSSEDALSQKIQAALTERYKDPTDPHKVLEDKVNEDFQLVLVDEVKDDAGKITNSVQIQLEKILTPEVWSKLSEGEKRSTKTMFRANAIQKHIEVQQSHNAPPLTPEEQDVLFKKQWFQEALTDIAQHNDRFRKALSKEIDFFNLDMKDKKPLWLKKLLDLLKKLPLLLLALACMASGSTQQGERKGGHA
jgi:hypothetical protein